MTAKPSAVSVPPWGLTLAAMLSVQLGSALSVDLIDIVGAAGTAWLRLSMGALVFLALARPPLRSVRREDVPALAGLGITSGLVTIAFLAAIAPGRLPLGTAVAVEFLGPLTVAAVRSHNVRALVWPVLGCSASSGSPSRGMAAWTPPAWASRRSPPSGGPPTSC